MLEKSHKRMLVRSVVGISIFSAAVNVLLLVSPLYLIQVYDRVIPSSSIDTLVYVTVLAAFVLVLMGILEIVRTRFGNRMASRLDVALGSPLFLEAMRNPRAGLGDVQLLRDLATIRGFVGSRSLFFLFDLPFAPFFILLLYFVHPLLFLITVAGAALLVGVAFINQAATVASGRTASESLMTSMNLAQSFGRNFETVSALGMIHNVTQEWGNRFADALTHSDSVAGRNAFFSGLSRSLRMGLQIGIMGVGGYLVVKGEMTAGMIFASSIISGRALQPLDQIIGASPQVLEANRAWKRIVSAVGKDKDIVLDTVALPDTEAKGDLSVEQLTYFPPGAVANSPPLIKRISFKVEAGETVAIIGPSRAGKSTLARLITGSIKPHSGVVRLDGADIRTLDTVVYGRKLGYLAQEVELFPGTIAKNISRFDPDSPDVAIRQAGERAHAHQVILAQKDGYATHIGPAGVRLSGGERQRIGLARAIYGDPKLLVLDEPNANLDAEGEQALEKAILDAKLRGSTVLIITHRPSIASKCDRVLMLRDGAIELYGPAKQVLDRLNQGKPPKSTDESAPQPAAKQKAPPLSYQTYYKDAAN